MNITQNETDIKRAADFLGRLAGDGLMAVACMLPDKGLSGATFNPRTDRRELEAWLSEHDGRRNLYYSLNEPCPANEQTGKGGRVAETDIRRLRGVAVDLDPIESEEAKEGGWERERKRLLSIAKEWSGSIFAGPTACIDTGNGVQMVWLFPRALAATEANVRAVKEQAVGLQRLFGQGSDAVQSVEHLYRIPWTTNLPNAKKRGKGRVATRSRLLHFMREEVCDLATLRGVAPPVPAQSRPQDASTLDIDYHLIIEAAENPDAAPSGVKTKIALLRAERGLTLETTLAKPDRSKRDFALACLCVEEGLTDPTELGQVVFSLAPEKLREKDEEGRGKDYAARTISKALSKAKPRLCLKDWFQPLGDEEPVGHILTSTAARSAPKPYVAQGLVGVENLPVRECLIHPRLPLGVVTIGTGEPGISKSTFAIHEALIVATGREDILRGVGKNGMPISPERLHRSGNVLVYNAEDSLAEMQRRAVAAQRNHSVTSKQMVHKILLWSGVDHGALKVASRDKDRANVVKASGAAALEEVIREHDVVLVYLDPQISLAEGLDENSNADIDALFQILTDISARCNCALVVLHHTSKATRNSKGDMGAGRGGFAAVGKARSAFNMTNVTGEGDEKDWGLGPSDNCVRLTYSKLSYAEKAYAPIVFRRHSVLVGNAQRAPTEVPLLPAGEELRASGDRAPSLELVDVKTLSEQSKARAVDNSDALKIAAIVSELIGDQAERPFSKIWKDACERMREAGLCKSSTRNNVTPIITSALSGLGIDVTEGSRNFTIRAVKEGKAFNASWTIQKVERREAPLNEQGLSELSGSYSIQE